LKKVTTLNKEIFCQNSKDLISKVNYKPDLVVGVLNGGGYVLDIIKQLDSLKNVNFCSAKLQRPDTIKNKAIVKFLLKKLPYVFLNYIRVLESKKAEKSICLIKNQAILKIKFHCGFNIDNLKVKRILIVDDALDTGRTVYMFKNNLQKMFPNAEIETAVLSWTIESSIIKPEYYLYKNVLVRYPWAKDYKGKDFEKKSFSC